MRASSYCTYSFFVIARYAIPLARDAISVSREGGNLLLSGTVKSDYHDLPRRKIIFTALFNSTSRIKIT